LSDRASIVVLIWLFLLGLSQLASGRYTPIEVVMTVVMAVCSAVGGAKSVRLGRSLSAAGRVTAFLMFAGLQVAAMWVSLLEPMARR
jgi:hypothetical protein